MRNPYGAVVQRDGKWFTAFCPEVPEANGQGKTREACLQSLAAAIELVLDYNESAGLKTSPGARNKPLFSSDETPRPAAALAGPRLPLRTRRRQTLLWTNPATDVVEAVPRHVEIGKHLARKICRQLSVPVPRGA